MQEVKQKEWNNYKMVDIVKYIAAIMVICIHCQSLVSSAYLNFFIKSVICRIAVPFFFISSAYFVRKGASQKPDYIKKYLTRLTKSYLAWSILFIPIGVDWVYQNLHLSGSLLPFALVYGLIHIGTYYHLWYIPAMLFSIYVVDRLLTRLSYKKVFSIAGCLFLFGSLETYYGMLPNGWFKEFFDMFIKIVFTTRSGLFFGMIFVLIGYFIYDYREKLQIYTTYISKLTALFAILLLVEGAFLYTVERLDMNFLIMLVPFSFCFFIGVISLPYVFQCDTKKYRELSKYYYFVHPVCIVIVEEVGLAFDLDFLRAGILSLLLIILLTHALSSCIVSFCQIKKSRVLIAAILGMGTTFILASLFFWIKPATIVVKFELVPCLWFFTSFCMYFVLDRMHQLKI